MTANTSIQWTDHTWNPWMGCERASPGCDHCYMFDGMKRFGRNPDVVQRTKTTFNAPLKWSEPAKVFTCSWSDFFHPDADPWRGEAWDIIRRTPHLTYQILTKRHARIARHLPPDWGDGYANVWLGVTCENQEWATRRITELRRVPARTRFISAEPLLGPLDLNGWLRGIEWVIIGGESGPKARPFDLQWARDIIAQCRREGSAPFVKQLGRHPIEGTRELRLKDSHGGDMSEWPEDLRVREFPLNAVPPEAA